MASESEREKVFGDFESDVIERMSEVSGPVDEASFSLVFSVVRLANRLVADLESQVHSEAGWSWAGFRIMLATMVYGELEPREISRLADVSRASVSSVLNTLERDGLVVRLRESEDRRLVTVRLTELGKQKISKAFSAHNERERQWVSCLSPAERDQFTRLARLVLECSPADRD